MTHTEAEKLFKRCRNKERGYKLANNTRIQKRGRAFAIKLHNTNVVIIRPDGTYRLNTDGWRTVTTKDRMNRILPARSMWSVNGIWYVDNVCYYDGMLVGPDGKVISDDKLPNMQKIKARVDRQVNKFVKTIIEKCVWHDIGAFELSIIPRTSSKTHLKKLWETIRIETTKHGDWAGGYPHLSKLLCLAVASSNHGNIQVVWSMIRSDFLRGRAGIVLDDLRKFMRPRKPIIAEMIATGEISG